METKTKIKITIRKIQLIFLRHNDNWRQEEQKKKVSNLPKELVQMDDRTAIGRDSKITNIAR